MTSDLGLLRINEEKPFKDGLLMAQLSKLKRNVRIESIILGRMISQSGFRNDCRGEKRKMIAVTFDLKLEMRQTVENSGIRI